MSDTCQIVLLVSVMVTPSYAVKLVVPLLRVAILI
jgi:hypothetical protein